MDKLRILEVGNNVKGNNDGIGKHARIIAKAMRANADVDAVYLIGGTTYGKSKAGMVISDVMTKVFCKIPAYIKTFRINCIIIEYPFMEYNPVILLALYYLKIQCRRLHCKLCISIHEYDRVKELRKKVIRQFAKHADVVFVSDENSRAGLLHYNRNIYIRTIPNHIPVKNVSQKKDRKKFVYFGLVSRAKAFDEMIEAWNLFNKDCQYILTVITMSDIRQEKTWKNVQVLKGLDDKKAAETMSQASYCMVPVLPAVGLNNSSFISALQCRCLTAGKFEDCLQDKDFVLNMKDYSIESFCDAFRFLVSLHDDELKEKQEKGYQFGKQFTAEETVNQMVQALKDI